jgi:hypothetical protein
MLHLRLAKHGFSVNDLDQCGLVVMRSFESMKIDEGGGNISQASVWKICSEPDTFRQTWASDGNGNLQRQGN